MSQNNPFAPPPAPAATPNPPAVGQGFGGGVQIQVTPPQVQVTPQTAPGSISMPSFNPGSLMPSVSNVVADYQTPIVVTMVVAVLWGLATAPGKFKNARYAGIFTPFAVALGCAWLLSL